MAHFRGVESFDVPKLKHCIQKRYNAVAESLLNLSFIVHSGAVMAGNGKTTLGKH